MAQLTIHLFGYPQILVDCTTIKLERRKTLALAVYLAVGGGSTLPAAAGGRLPGSCGRAELATLLWPDCSQEQAGAYLRQSLWDFGKAAGEEWIVKNSEFAGLNPAADIWVDVNRFEALRAQCKTAEPDSTVQIALLDEAISLYQSDFLAGFTLRDSPTFDDWQTLQAETLRLHLAQSLETLARLYTGKEAYAAAETVARRWFALNPFDEAANRALMHLYTAMGQRSAALRQYEACRNLLKKELSVDPETETVALYERIRRRTINPTRPGSVQRSRLLRTTTENHLAPAPSGTVTFLFTDIEGSTQLWEQHPEAMQIAFERHESLLRATMAKHHGYVYKMIGDAFQVAFDTAPEALAASLAAQRALWSEPWGEIGMLKVRMALHTGVTEERGDDYIGPGLNRVARVLSAGHGGQVLLNQTTYELVHDQLPQGVSLRDLGEQYLKDLLHPEHIYQVVAEGLPDIGMPLKVVEAPMDGFPHPTTAFVGREAELAQISKFLRDAECRLITLVGIGGTGKTRLAIEAAGCNRALFQEIRFASLEAVFSLENLVLTIAEAFKLTFRYPQIGGLPIEAAQAQLLASLAQKRALLVLDNFEQLSGYAGFVSELLAAAPQIKLIVTSRERLNLTAEWVVEVSGLAFPGSQASATIPEYAAVQLFVKCAARSAQFDPNAADWPAIARICQVLEGIPLGVEMAAAWVKLLACQEIAAEIERDQDFLAAGWRGMPERQRTLGAVFEHSWKLLSEGEREVFRRLSLFQGGFERAAALEVAGAALPLLAALMDKSFVRRVSSGRFEIHPVLKKYAIQKLAEDPKAQIETRARYTGYFSAWMDRIYVQLKGREQLTALAALRTEAPNLRSAWSLMIEQRDLERLRQAFPAMILYYEMCSQPIEGVEVTGQFLTLLRSLEPAHSAAQEAGADNVPQALLALALAALRRFNLDPAHFERSNRYQQESLQRLASLPDSQEKAMALLLNCAGQGSLPAQQVLALCRECAGLFRRLDDAWGAALAELVLADTANFGGEERGAARGAYLSSLKAFSQLNNDWGRAMCLFGLMSIERQAGRLEQAASLGRQSLEIYEQMRNLDRVLLLRHLLGEIAGALGTPDEARKNYEANLSYYSQMGDEPAQEQYRRLLAVLDEGQAGA